MRIRFAVDGGLAHFPGLAGPVEISTEDLPPAEAADLARKLERARPFGLVVPASTRRQPDTRRHTVRAEERGKEETLVFG